ncbi:MAG: Ni-sirohydrochlorin a,c-diamide synthase [Methanocorpusculum sp.]|nr:Ni-sirohydrochlorin a,c-diamide synthase [Methanocorpusculum sp.]
MKSFLISGDRSGAGKTTITLALASLLSKEGSVQTYKTAMDYIDSSYLAGVTKRSCYNLDSFVQTESESRRILSLGADADFGVVEGVRGLFEGLDAFSDVGSTASIAKMFDLPVILVINARSITRSAAAIVNGFRDFDKDVNIAGVILNNTGHGRHVSKAVDAIEYYCKLPVLGAVPRSENIELASRHLGLVPFLERSQNGEFAERISKISEFVSEHVDLNAVKSIAKNIDAVKSEPLTVPQTKTAAIAYDESFNFYYGELADILKNLGFSPKYFSPIHDDLPDADTYIFGGGYPEMFAEKLEANDSMREDILSRAKEGTPIYAECGGLMYLSRSLSVKGTPRKMCGVFEGDASIPVKKVLGYVVGEAELGGVKYPFKGHEFHYSAVKMDTGAKFAYSLSRGTGIDSGKDGAVYKNCIGSYTHLMPVSSERILCRILCGSEID